MLSLKEGETVWRGAMHDMDKRGTAINPKRESLDRYYLKEGDKICILPKPPLPIIVRSEGNSYFFNVIGLYFVYSIMDEEMEDKVRNDKLHLWELKIR